MSSRLFMRLREKMGLVYSVYTSPWMGRNNGVFSVCANVNVSNVERSVAAVREEIDRLLSDGVTAEETQKAKTQLKVTALFGKENPMNYMLSLMRRRLLVGEDYELDKLIARIESITAADIDGAAREILGSGACFGYAGKKPKRHIDEIYNNK